MSAPAAGARRGWYLRGVPTIRGLALRAFVVVPVGAVVMLLGSCASRASPSSADDGGVGGTASFGALDASLSARAGRLLGTCSGGPESSCHASGAGGMHLPDDPPNLVDVPSTERPSMVRVRRFDPDQSYLMLKILDDGGIDGGRMPLGGTLEPAEIETLRAWIAAGAP
jgi:hypothetical protein